MHGEFLFIRYQRRDCFLELNKKDILQAGEESTSIDSASVAGTRVR